MIKHKRSVRGSLLKGVLEGIPSEGFNIIAESIEETMKGEAGIYALYKKDKLYYVGLARNLKGRVRKHTVDRHAKKWDTFSVYIINKVKYLGDVETIILRIIDPMGNRVKGRIPKLNALTKILEEEAREKTRELNNLRAVLGRPTRRKTKKKATVRKTKRKTRTLGKTVRKTKTRRKTVRKK